MKKKQKSDSPLRAATCSALEVALEKYLEAKSILAENPSWKPAQERFEDAEMKLEAECQSAIAELKAKILPNAYSPDYP
jgi:hypothetical protein